MSPRDWRLRIQDMLEAIERIQDYTAGMNAVDFCADRKTIDAVIRNLEVIGEAARHVPDEIVAQYPELPWEEMRGMRNILIHEYFGVSVPILWHTVTANLPLLAPKLCELLAQAS